MGSKIYVDTNVFLDYIKDRRNHIRPLGELAYNLFRRVFACEFEIVISDITMTELKGELDRDEIKILLGPFYEAGKLHLAVSDREMTEYARKLSWEREVPKKDCLHALIAAREGCIVVTRDEHFKSLQDIATTCFPENVP